MVKFYYNLFTGETLLEKDSNIIHVEQKYYILYIICSYVVVTAQMTGEEILDFLLCSRS